jgi:general secretion pathway protein H
MPTSATGICNAEGCDPVPATSSSQVRGRNLRQGACVRRCAGIRCGDAGPQVARGHLDSHGIAQVERPPGPSAAVARSTAVRAVAARGFSLMEILVVIVILAVVAGAVSIAIAGAGGERALTREAERAQALIEFACERAQLSGQPIGISLSRAGYRFSRFEREVWLPDREETLRARNWPPNLSVALSRDDLAVRLGDDFPERPQLLCYASGELTAFRLDLALPDLAHRYRIDGQGDGHVLLTAVDARAR